MLLIHKETAEIVYVWNDEDYNYFFIKDVGHFPWAYRVDQLDIENFEILGWL